MRELVKSCFKEINSLKEQLNEENKDIKTNEVVKNVLIQNESNKSDLHKRINELSDELEKQENALKENELKIQEKDTQLKEKDLQISEIQSKLETSLSSLNSTEDVDEYKKQINDLQDKIRTQNVEISELKESEKISDDDAEKDLKDEISRLKSENEQLKGASSQTEIHQLKTVIDRQNEELKEIPELKNQLTREVGLRDQKIKKYEEEIESLKNNNTNADNEETEQRKTE